MSTTISPCSCDGDIQNFGKPGCLTDIGAPLTLIIAQRTKADGSPNCIDLTQTLDATYMNGLINNSNADERYLVIPNIKAYTPEQADSVTQEFSNGDISTVRKGVASVEYQFECGDPYKLMAKWEAIECLDLMAFFVDTEGNLIGKCPIGDDFCGLDIAKNSFVITPTPKTYEVVNTLMVKYNYEITSGFSKFDYIANSDFTDFDATSIEPLRDVNIEITGVTATTMDFRLFLDWGSAVNRSTKGVTGLTTLDLNLKNVTDDLTTPFLTLVEDPLVDGGYNSTFASQDSTDLVNVEGIGGNVIPPLALNRLQTEIVAIP